MESLCDIYLIKNDIPNYVKYATKLYGSDKLKEQNQRKTINMIILIFGKSIMCVVFISRMQVIKMLKQSNFTDGMTSLYN